MSTVPEKSVGSVSIVIPAHNEARLIGGTLSQLIRAFLELKTEFEIIVVNDDSTDLTAAIAKQAGAVVIDVALRNIGAVRNAGAEIARFEYLIFVDADTLVPAATLAATIDALNSGNIGGGAFVELSAGPRIHWSKYWVYPLAVTLWQRVGRWAAGCYMFCRADAFREMGGFPEEYFAAEEYFFSSRLKKMGSFVILRQPVQTSPRKLHDYSVWQLLRFVIRPFFSRNGMLKSRQGLEILYEHPRNAGKD